MQGKERNQLDIDEQFVSDAWLAMKEMLDREMPVQAVETNNGRKRYLLSLLLLLIVVGVGTALWLSYSDNAVDSKNSNPTPITSERPQANLETINTPINSENKDEASTAIISEAVLNPEVKTRSSNTSSNTTASVSSNNATVSTKPQPPSSKNNSFELATPVPSTANALPATETSRQSSDEVSFRWTSPQSENEMVTSKELPNKTTPTIATPTKATSAAISASNLLARLQTESLEPIVPKVVPSIISLPTVSPWGMGIQAGKIRDNSSKRFNGWEVGLLLSYRLDRRFALQSGLEMHHLTKTSAKNDNTLSATDFNSVDFENLYTPGLRDGKDLSNLAAEKLNEYFYEQATLRNLNYLKVPLQLSYTLHPRIRINTGVNVGYLLTKLNNAPPTDGLTTLEAINKDAITQKGEVATDVLLQGLKSWDYGLEFGISFYPTKRWGIELTYNHGLQDFTDNRFFGFKESHVNQYLAVGMTYHLFNLKGS